MSVSCFRLSKDLLFESALKQNAVLLKDLWRLACCSIDDFAQQPLVRDV
jgi:hypothetical protein